MKKIIKYIAIGFCVFIIGGLGGLMVDYVIFSKLITHPKWSKNPIIETLSNRVTVIKNTEKVIVENHESIADIAGQASASVVYVEAVSADGVKKSGNGIVVGSDGVIATTLDMTDESNIVYVKLANNTIYTASNSYTDQYTGITFLRIDANDLATISFANSDDAQNGKRLIGITQSRVDNGAHFSSGGFIGNEYDYSIAAPKTDHLQGVLKIDLSDSVFHTSVGAPVVDYHGNMVGLIAQKDIKKATGEIQAEYYAVAANDAYKAFEEFLRSEEDMGTGVLFGVDYEIIGGIDVHINDLSVDSGAQISTPITYQEKAIFNKTLAAQNGLRGGDIIVTVDNVVVDVKNNLSRLMHKVKEGDDVTVKVLRGEKLLSIDIAAE